jgi:poly(A) polymerase
MQIIQKVQKMQKDLEIINLNLSKIYDLSLEMNVETFIVGGFIRDFLLGNISTDIDFMTMTDTKNFATNFANLVKGAFVVLDDEQKSFRVVKRFNRKIFSFDFTEKRASDLDGDLQNRDFSINALAIPLSTNAGFLFNDVNPKNFIIDLTNGLEDLKNKKIRAVNDHVFDDDPLRLLRAFRLASKYQFTIDDNTKILLQQKSNLITKSSGERIHDELLKFFSHQNIFGYLLDMDGCKLLENIFPEIIFMKTQNEYYYHKSGLFGHSLEVLFCFEFIVSNLSEIFASNKKIQDLFVNHLSEDFNLAKLKLLCLFHDIGKPDCFSMFDGKIHFFKHDEISSKYIKKMFKNLKFSNNEIDFIAGGALCHMQAGNLAKQPEITPRACFRFFKRTENFGVGLLLFTMADWLASIRGSNGLGYDDGINSSEFGYLDFVNCKNAVEKILDWYITETEKPVVKKYLDGNLIMQKFNLQPSKLIGEILLALEEAQVIGTIKTEAEAYSFVQNYLEDKKAK